MSRSSGNAASLGARRTQRYYRPELDVLRFVAFFIVYLSHVVPGDEAFYARAHVPARIADLIVAFCAGGAFGVDLFFALSSFLITTLLLRENDERATIDVRSFYIRRMLRIWPLYFLFLLIITPALDYILPDHNMPGKYTLAFALLSGNWACVRWGYPHSVAGPLWSVSIEEQFYLIWPFVMRRWIRHLPIVASVLLAVSFMTRLYLVTHGAVHPQIWCNTLARLDPIACGALLAVWTERNPATLSAWARLALLGFGCAVLTAAGHYGDFVGTRALITYPAVSVACIALILGVLGWQMPSGRGPMIGVLMYLGRISYGLYVFHWMFVVSFGVAKAHGPVARPALALAALLATITTAAVSYHFLETPFLRLKERFARVKSAPAGAMP